MSQLSEKLAARIKKEFDIDVDPEIRRTRSGYWQKMSGAWSWTMQYKRGVGCVASQYTAKEIASSKEWEHMWDGLDLVLFPVTKKSR